MIHPRHRIARRLALLAIVLLATRPAAAIDIVIDYTYDSSGFFSSSTANGSKARAALESAADFYSGILQDTFSAVQTPAPFYSQVASGSVIWTSQIGVLHPATGNPLTLYNLSLDANEYRIYAGARSIPGPTIGFGGTSSPGWSRTPNGSFSSQEIDQIEQITDDFVDALLQRGESSGFASWGGYLSFDTTANWNYDHTKQPAANQTDFYSTAIHELAHALGYGGSQEWVDLVVANPYRFDGSASKAEYGGRVPLDTEPSSENPNVDVPSGHWLDQTTSRVYGGLASQEASLTPGLLGGERKLLTALDAAALTDLGWSLVEPEVPLLVGDYNNNGVVDAADFTVWRDRRGTSYALPNRDPAVGGVVKTADYDAWVSHFGDTLPGLAQGTSVPEPGAALLIASAAAVLLRRR
ncbi:hypothetical protein Mal64_38450 [Pseudobythopirellula maris]|uniref:Peptidase M10 metallopeptidase domain-containing protein n=1 Tax=Pseudobythopirellula maris TaxID=2527991 RepID=A0A5C5ZGR5_9BACT|nr:hypothetical protein [Pseudobythopirellula maris]TWT86305.1 hypothetical protein Mal64_38450 [Pseudobythopirellula maris]